MGCDCNRFCFPSSYVQQEGSWGCLSWTCYGCRCPFSPFKNDSFDAVFALHVLGHMHESDRDQTALTLLHILKPGGILFFSDFSTSDFRFGKGYETEPATFRRGTDIVTHYFSREEVLHLFSSLTLVSIRIHQWPMRVMASTLVRSEIQATFTR